MSRYVQVEVEITAREELRSLLEALELPFEIAEAGEMLMLEGSLECAGEPVEVRIAPGTLGAVEDFGFARHEGRYRLVCGELDQSRLEAHLLPRLRERATMQRALAHAEREGLDVEQHVEPDGTRRIVLKRK